MPNTDSKDRVRGHQDVSKREARAMKRRAKQKAKPEMVEVFKDYFTAPCPNCGSMDMVKSGSAEVCADC